MDIIEQAIEFAVHAHEGQKRKYKDLPYILHPMEVAVVISTITQDKEVIAAGILHDTIEDCGVLAEEITEKFGLSVSLLVQSESEDKLEDRPPAETWFERKESTLLILSHTKDVRVKIMWLGDKLSNLRSFYREYKIEGSKVWDRLHMKDPKMQEWYYRTVASSMTELKDTDAYKEFCELIELLFAENHI